MINRNKKIQALLLAGFISVTSITGGLLQTKYQYNSSASSSVVQTKQVGTTIANLNMRNSASTTGKILTTLKKDTKVDVLQKESNGWYKISVNGKTGYVTGQYLKVDNVTINTNTNTNTNTGTSTTKQVGITTANLNMRDSASTTGKILTTLKKDTKVDVLQRESNGWYKISVNGKTGYVTGQYLKVDNQTVNKPNDNINNDSTQKPNGIELNSFANKLPNMGFDNSGTYWENGLKMGTVYVMNDQVVFSLRQNSDTFNNIIKDCLNMLLPTGGNEVYNIVSKEFSNQTIEMDGRVVSMEQTSVGVGITIRNK